MDLSIEECTSHIYEEDIDKALYHIFNALRVLEVRLLFSLTSKATERMVEKLKAEAQDPSQV